MQYAYIKQDDMTIFCMGVYDDIHTAIGYVMEEVWCFQESYKKDEGSVYEISSLYDLEGESGWGIEVTYKAPTWDEARKEYHYILKHWNEEEKDGTDH